MRNVTVIPASLNKFSDVPLATTKKRKVAVYARVSTDDEDQQTSYAAQCDYYERYIRSREDWEFVGLYSDEEISGCNTKKREGFRSMVQDALDDTAGSADTDNVVWYRVRKSWKDAASQKGAFKILSNAKKCADENPGYSVFDDNGKVVYGAKGTTSSLPYLVKVSIPDLNIRRGPGTDHARTGSFTGVGIFTIVEVRSGQGSASGWGRLKSGAGWISLDYTSKV